MTYYSNPKEYWEERLRRDFTLSGVGHIGFGERYNRWLYRRKLRCLERALRGVPMQGKHVLDVGCGTGFFTRWYLARGCEVTGIDITEVSISKLRAELKGDFYSRDITAADYPRSMERFDIVNMWDVIYHIVDNDAYDRALDNITSNIKEGGLLLLTDFFGFSTDKLIAQHVLGRCLATYHTDLIRRGLELVKIRPLYRLLSKSNLGRLDEYLAGIYYCADNLTIKIAPNNLSLSVWRRGASRSRSTSALTS